jgi:DNA-binding PucR family transcriptional regulator
LTVAQRSGQRLVNYFDVALLASALQDDLLLTSLRRIYLEPLATERDGGAAAKRTLRAYFEAAGNISSAATAAGITRVTVRKRLLAIEERFGRPLASARGEIELALRLDEIDAGERASPST